MKTRVSLILAGCLLVLQPLNAQVTQSLEGFDDVENIIGWEFSNQSNPIGDSNWFQGNGDIFTAQAGDPGAFIAANHRNTESTSGNPGVICNYLIMPNLGYLDSVSFYSRSRIASNNLNIFPDRLYMVYSPTGEINPGNCTDNFGDFTETLLVINPDLTQEAEAPEGYPLNEWLKFSSEINGDGRVAFVYYVEDAGFYGTNSNYIGIDTVEWQLGVAPNPVPQSIPTKPKKCVVTKGNFCQTVKF